MIKTAPLLLLLLIPTARAEEILLYDGAPRVIVIDSVPGVLSGSTVYRAAPKQLEAVDLTRIARQALELQKAFDKAHAANQSRTLDFVDRLIERARSQEKPAEPKPTAITQACGKCHGGDGLKGSESFRLDRSFDTLKALRAVSFGEMPPEGLPADKRVEVIRELLDSIEESEQ